MDADINARVLVVGAGPVEGMHNVFFLEEVRALLKEKGLTVITATPEELEAAKHSAREIESLPPPLRAERLMRLAIVSSSFDRGLEEIPTLQDPGWPRKEDRPAWKSPYGPARSRRK